MQRRNLLGLVISCVTFGLLPAVLAADLDDRLGAKKKFQLNEASISDIHRAIETNQLTCRGVVQAYLKRAAAYDGVCTQLITTGGTPIPPATGAVRAGTALKFPTQTVAASSVLPNLEQYAGLPLDLGRMEATRSDPSVQQQQGMRVGIPNAGQLNALETLNLRGERSVACKAACDVPPAAGPLPSHCPVACEAFRQQPDALERAAQLDAQYGSHPPFDQLPMYCIPVVFKDPYDTKDMRSTANSDVNFAMDAPPFDSTIAAQLRAKGAIIYAKGTAHEFNAGPGDPGGPNTPTTNYISGGQAISGWGGQACNPYDTERVPRGSSSGPGVAVSANLATVGICEQTQASCQGPASRNNLVLILATSGVLPDAGGTGNQYFVDRPGIYGKTVQDAARVLDAIKDPAQGYFDPRSIYTALPKALIPQAPYTSFVLTEEDLKKQSKPLAGLRVGIVREFMTKDTPNTSAIIGQMDTEFKTILRDRLGAQLVESVEPLYGDDPGIPNMLYTFQDAFAEILPRLMPGVFSRTTSSGARQYAVPGYDVTSYDYLLLLSRGEAPLSSNLNLRTIAGGGPDALPFKFEIERYLLDRGDARIKNWADWVANAKFRDDSSRAGAENWVLMNDVGAEGKTDRLAMSHVARLAILKVMHENNIDVFVNPENTTPPGKIGGPSIGPGSCCGGFTALLQIPQMVVPAGYTQVVYEGRYALNTAKTNYTSVLNTQQSSLPKPMPISMMFWAGPGDEPKLLKATSAYEAATKHRMPPPAFGPVPGEP
jgi:Asp-tRNA(Asn)/Glu-tRNA(Gln) amidotransferase A subunit family amidase